MTKPAQSPLHLVLLGAMVVVLGVVVVTLVRTQNRLDALGRDVAARPSPQPPTTIVVETPSPSIGTMPTIPSSLRAPSAPTGTNEATPPSSLQPAGVPLPPPPMAMQGRAVTVDLDQDDHAPVAPPKTKESQEFVAQHGLSPDQWSDLVHVNRNWVRRVDRASKFGETAFGGPPDAVAAERERKLESVLGSADAVKDFHALEAKSKGGRVTVDAGGKSIQAVIVE